MTTFGARLARVFTSTGRLCVGIDPHGGLLGSWGWADDAAGAERLGRTVVAACAGRAGIVKPQVACFERFGSAGYRALERVLEDARQAGLIVIADAKRGDIGSTMESYAAAWLEPGSPLEADAVTLTAYVGVGALEKTMERALAHGKGVFVLAATSNPEAGALQGCRDAQGETVAARIVAGIRGFNARRRADPGGADGGSVQDRPADQAPSAPQNLPPLDSAGVVLGATVRLSEVGIRTDRRTDGGIMPVLAPGFGSQGARLEDLPSLFGSFGPGVIVHESRALLGAGPHALADEISRHADRIRASDG